MCTGTPGRLDPSPMTARSCELEVWFRRAKHPFPAFPSCSPVQQTLPQDVTTPTAGGRGKPQDLCCAQPVSLSCVSLDMFVSLLGERLCGKAPSLPSCPVLVGLSHPSVWHRRKHGPICLPGWGGQRQKLALLQANGLKPMLLNQQCSCMKLSRACVIRSRTEMSLDFL